MDVTTALKDLSQAESANKVLAAFLVLTIFAIIALVRHIIILQTQHQKRCDDKDTTYQSQISAKDQIIQGLFAQNASITKEYADDNTQLNIKQIESNNNVANALNLLASKIEVKK